MNGIIQEGLDNNKSKPFWKYQKQKTRYYRGYKIERKREVNFQLSVKGKYFGETIPVSVYSVQGFSPT